MYYSFDVNIHEVIKPEPHASVHGYGTERCTSAPMWGDIPQYQPLVLESQPPPCLRLVVYFFSGDLVSCKAIDTSPLHSWKSALWLRSLLGFIWQAGEHIPVCQLPPVDWVDPCHTLNPCGVANLMGCSFGWCGY
jgi:hypothetical protein